MMWRYSRRDTRLLLVATLLVAAGYGLVLAQGWQTALQGQQLTANSVGILAAVPDNGVNSLVAQLDAKEQELNQREAALRAVERQAPDTTTLMYVSIIGTALLALILLNFYLDNRRRHSLT